jgi:hypothetical protein
MKHLRYFESVEFEVDDIVILFRDIQSFQKGDICKIIKIDNSPNWPYLIADDKGHENWVGKPYIRKATDEEVYNYNLKTIGNKYNI